MIETERLILREWRDEDRAPFFAMCNSVTVMAHLGGPADAAAIDAGIARIRACQAAHGHCFWAVERQDDREFLGFCGLKIADDPGSPIEGDIEIGWRLREEAWGHGYAGEAARASLAWGWANLECCHIIAVTVLDNARSWRLMERLGMERRPDLDFDSAVYPPGHTLHHEIVYVAKRPR